MKNYFLFLVTIALISCTTAETESTESAMTQELYQLKIYTCKTEGQIQMVDSYLAEAYLPALKRLGLQNIGVFKPRIEEVDTVKNIYVLIPFSSLEQFASLEDQLAEDSIHLASGRKYLTASYKTPAYERIASILMKAFIDMPKIKTPVMDADRSDRIYELRSYESTTETYYQRKVDMFNAGGEIKLFDRLGFNAVFFAEVLSGPKMPNLMYMTTFPDQQTRDSLWTSFFDSQEWTALKKVDKYKNTVSNADIILLYPTAYSDY